MVGAMTHFPQPHPRRRATRILMTKPVTAIVVQEDGQHSNCKLQIVSVTGGLLQVGKPLSTGNFVELAFQANSSTVHGMAEMLSPMAEGEGSLQPFRFIALDDDDHHALRMLVDAAADQKAFVSSTALRRI
jgi:hypothetical protein